MTLRQIAIKNILRRKSKSFFVLAGLVIGIASVVTFTTYSEAMTIDVKHKIEKFGANIIIVPRQDHLPLNYGGLSLGGLSFEMKELYIKDLKAIWTTKNAANIAAAGPILLGAVTVKKTKVLLAGINFYESRILKPWWKMRGSSPQKNELLAGSNAAKMLNLKKDEFLTLKGKKVKVAGILNPTGAQDDNLLFTPIETAQTILGKKNRVSMIEVAAHCTACPITEMVAQISEKIPSANVMPIQQIVKSRMESLKQFKSIATGASILLLIAGGFITLITMLSSVRERTDELGIFGAIGFRKSHISKIILFEAGLLSFCAGILGTALGYVIAIGAVTLTAADRHISVPFNIEIGILAVVIALFIGTVASLYPARVAANMDPTDALREL